ncbi:hypothetical protein FQN54_002917 [Arachnomyces sp. PD_36]|nr:hypothetical protein FQN54_002917 [Arachnomyces sp. PD_36]
MADVENSKHYEQAKVSPHDSRSGEKESTFHTDGVGEIYSETHRGLNSRHIQFLALGGCIGTGLFVGAGAVLADVGPAVVRSAPLLMSYIVMSMVVWVIMNALGEMTTYLPVQGVSIPYFVNRFADPSLAFAVGYNYWFSFSMLIATEATAAALIVEYWTKAVPVGVWIAIVLAGVKHRGVILFLNIVAVSFFGEAEFWFASIKILTIIGLIILGIVLFFGGGPNHDRLGFRYWERPGAFNPFLVGGDTGRFLGFWYAFIKSGFSFICSPELITMAAGEAEAPRRNIPKAASRFIYRLLFFYILGSWVMGIMVAHDDKNLLSAINSGGEGANASPFVVGIQNAGIAGLNHVINAAILTSAWSSGNSWLFAGSRSLYSLACTGQAPRIFMRCNKRGIPYVAVLFTFLIGCLSFLNLSNSGATVFVWFTSITTVGGFISWIVVLVTHIRFRQALNYNNLLHTLPYATPLQPYATYFALFMVVLLAITNGFYVFFDFNVSDFFVNYVTFPAFFALYFGHKILRRTPWMIKLSEVDLLTGKEEIDRLTEMDVERKPRNWAEKVWFWLV